jgi:hypothetical protein
MKNIILLLVIFSISLKTIAQSSTIASNYIVIPGVATMPACGSTGKGRTVFNTTDNRMYYCDGFNWQSMAGVPSAGVGWAQNGTAIYNTNAGGVGIGTPFPLTKLTVYTPTSNYGLWHTDANVGIGTYVSPSAGLIGTSSNHSLGFFANGFPAKMIIGTNGYVGIGAGTPEEKLTINTPLNNYGMLHTGSGISVGSYLSSVGGAIGTKTNHPFSLFANNSAAALTIKTNADVEVATGIYSSSTPNLNIVPLGIVKFYDFVGDEAPEEVTNIAGSLMISKSTNYSSAGDSYDLFLTLDPNIVNNYATIIPMVTSLVSGFVISTQEVVFTSSNVLKINFRIQDLFSGFYVPNLGATIIFYGIK